MDRSRYMAEAGVTHSAASPVSPEATGCANCPGAAAGQAALIRPSKCDQQQESTRLCYNRPTLAKPLGMSFASQRKKLVGRVTAR